MGCSRPCPLLESPGYAPASDDFVGHLQVAQLGDAVALNGPHTEEPFQTVLAKEHLEPLVAIPGEQGRNELALKVHLLPAVALPHEVLGTQGSKGGRLS